MAIALSIKDEGGMSPLSLLGTYLYPADWQSSPTDQGMMETFDMRAVGTDSQMIGAVNDFDDASNLIFQYWDDPLKAYPWWLTMNATSETAKRSLIRSLTVSPASSRKFNPTLGKGGMFYELLIERMPWWENISSTSVAVTGISALGGKWIPSLTQGTLPSRISTFEVIPDTGMNVDQSTIWLGIQPGYAGYTNFKPKMEAEDGTRLNSASLETLDADDSGNNVKSVALTSSYVEHLSINFFQHHPTAPSLYRGRFLLLGRMKLSTSGTAAVRVKWGCVDATGRTLFPNQPVYVSSTQYKMYELGEVSFPSFGGSDSYVDSLEEDGFIIEAKLVSGGTVSLHMDCFVLMPCRHMVKVSNCHVIDSTDDWRTTLYSRENDVDFWAYNSKNFDTTGRAQSQFSKWEIPLPLSPSGVPMFVICTQRNSGYAPLGENLTLSMNYYPRWANHRE